MQELVKFLNLRTEVKRWSEVTKEHLDEHARLTGANDKAENKLRKVVLSIRLGKGFNDREPCKVCEHTQKGA